MSTTIGKIYDLVEEFAPFDLAYDGDNVGHLVGSLEDELTGIVFALDVNIEAVQMAIDMKANLIVSHHPVIFTGLKEITDRTATGKVLQMAMKNGINIICAHTNLDAADEGVNQTLAEKIGLRNISTPELSNLMRVGELETETDTDVFLQNVKKALNIESLFISKKHPTKIKTAAVASGRGCSLIYEAKQTGADVFLLGEIKHENAVYADILDLCVVSCGHHETEVIVLDRLKTYLQNRLNKLQLNLGVYTDAPMVKK